MHPISKSRRWAVAIALCLTLALFGVAAAAEVVSQDVYRLAAGEIAPDDLYVTAGRIIIDGIVEGDLVATGGVIEVNGEVRGDVTAAGAGITIAGVVGDDVRVAGASIELSGRVGDDFFAAGGGAGVRGMPSIPFQVGGQTIVQGVRLAGSSSVGGDAIVVGGEGSFAGAITGNLSAAMGVISLTGLVGGDAVLRGGAVQVGDSAQVAGALRYTTGQEITVPAGVAERVEYEPPAIETAGRVERFLRQGAAWLLRTLLMLVGLALLAWVIMRLAPGALQRPVAAIDRNPIEAAIYGMIVAVAALPVTAGLVFLVSLFWGWFPGGAAVLLSVFGVLGLLWNFSVLITGLWLGRRLLGGRYAGNDLAALLVGGLAIALAARVAGIAPCVGPVVSTIIYLLSFVFAAGSLVVARQRPAPVPAGA